MQRDGIIHSTRNTLVPERTLHTIALWSTNRVLMKDVLAPTGYSRRGYSRHVRERAIVLLRAVSAGLIPVIDMAQLDPQYRRLNFIQPAVPTLFGTHVFTRFPVHP